jgi:hypothetical protein
MKLFFAYAREDSHLVRLIADKLRAAGHEYWVDVEGIAGGQNWMAAIERGIREADALLVLVSPYSAASRWVTQEAAYARVAGTPIIPVLVRPTEDMPWYLIDLHYIDLGDDPAARVDELVSSLQQRIEVSSPSGEPSLSEEFRQEIKKLDQKPLPDRIFIAYSHKQEPLAKELAEMLRDSEKSVFYDAHIRGGANWRRTIQKALDDATHVVVIWTADAAESDEVELEITYARGEGKYVIPLLSPDLPKLPYHLYHLQYIYFDKNLEDIKEPLLRAIAHRNPDEGIWQ